MKKIGSGVELCMLIGLVMLLGVSCSLICDGNSKRFTRELCDDPLWITQVGDSYSYRVRSSATDDDSITIDFKGFYGRDTVWELHTTHTVLVNYDLIISDIQAEVFKLVVVQEETGGITLISWNESNSLGHLVLTPPGTYTIKLIGYDAQGSLHMYLDAPTEVLVIDRFSERW